MTTGIGDHVWTIKGIVGLRYNRITYEGLDNDESEFIAKPNAPKSRNGKNKEKTWVSYHMAGFNYHF